MSYDYDLVVIGSGPAGQKAAIQAAKLGRTVALVERHQLGGVSVNSGTIPSKTLREVIVYLTGMSQRANYGQSYRVKDEITMEDLRLRTGQVIEREVDVVRHQLHRNHVHVVTGGARFVDPHTVAVGGADERRLTAEHARDCYRVAVARRDRHGAGAAGLRPRVRPGHGEHGRAAPDRDLHDPRDQLRRSHRGGAHRGGDPDEVGISRYRELARGHILGDTYGMLKLLVSTADRTILGVHVLGTSATEVVHIGQTVIGLGGTVDYLVDTVFNYPTLAESYKVAALDARNRLNAVARLAR